MTAKDNSDTLAGLVLDHNYDKGMQLVYRAMPFSHTPEDMARMGYGEPLIRRSWNQFKTLTTTYTAFCPPYITETMSVRQYLMTQRLIASHGDRYNKKTMSFTEN